MNRSNANGNDMTESAEQKLCRPEPVWNCQDAARFLHVHQGTVKRLARSGILPAFRIGNRWRFRPSELDAWARSAVSSVDSLRRE